MKVQMSSGLDADTVASATASLHRISSTVALTCVDTMLYTLITLMLAAFTSLAAPPNEPEHYFWNVSKFNGLCLTTAFLTARSSLSRKSSSDGRSESVTLLLL